MWTLFPMNPVMRRLGWGVFLLLWPLNLGDGQWMTLVTGLAGGFLLLLALWRLRDAGGYFRRCLFLASPGAAAPGGRIGGLLLSGGGPSRSGLPPRPACAPPRCSCRLPGGSPAGCPPGSRLRPPGRRRRGTCWVPPLASICSWPTGAAPSSPHFSSCCRALSNRGAEGRPGGADRVYPAALSGTPGQLGGGPRLSGDVRRHGRLRHGR